MKTCSFDGCGKSVSARGLCVNHYALWRRGRLAIDAKRERQPAPNNRTCTIPGCSGEYVARGYCNNHYAQWSRNGDPLLKKRAANGDGWINENGYHARRVGDEYRLVHREVMERLLGRPLLTHEQVHHKNGQRSDNRPENLELWSTSQPPGQRIADKLRWAHELIRTYEPQEDRAALAYFSDEELRDAFGPQSGV